MAEVVKLFQTEISDKELYELVIKYGTYYYKVLTYKENYNVELDDIVGELAVKACEAKAAFAKRSRTDANIKTFIITAFRSRMADYRKYLNVRQRKYPMARVVDC
jgi:DNA-directed RNA polymerase specialized sigma24 family protein